MLWNIVIAAWIGVIASTLIVVGAKTYWAYRLGRTCSNCTHDAGDGTPTCYHGMGWEPQPWTRYCMGWKPKENS